LAGSRRTWEIGLIFYSITRAYAPQTHVELEIEGQCYNLLWGTVAPRPLYSQSEGADGLVKARYPFVRLAIQVTHNELQKLKARVWEYRSWTCMIGVAKVLDRHLGIYIPFPISYYPSPSALYLLSAKALGDRRITELSVESHGMGCVPLATGVITGALADVILTLMPLLLTVEVANWAFGTEVSKTDTLMALPFLTLLNRIFRVTHRIFGF
jgi:hypothetical protein